MERVLNTDKDRRASTPVPAMAPEFHRRWDMPQPISRRTVLKTAAATALTLPLVRLGQAEAAGPGWVAAR